MTDAIAKQLKPGTQVRVLTARYLRWGISPGDELPIDHWDAACGGWVYVSPPAHWLGWTPPTYLPSELELVPVETRR